MYKSSGKVMLCVNEDCKLVKACYRGSRKPTAGHSYELFSPDSFGKCKYFLSLEDGKRRESTF